LPFFEDFRGVGAPGVVAIVVRSDDLAEKKVTGAVVPAGEADGLLPR
jgi:hypothetical protein